MNPNIADIVAKPNLSKGDLIALLSVRDPADVAIVRVAAARALEEHCGKKVHFRGLIEFSNECMNDCFYCGIRRSNESVTRYRLTHDEIVERAVWCAEAGYGSVVLQSGEMHTPEFVDFVEMAVRAIKAATISDRLPRGVGITLSVGEHSRDVLQRFFDAGAHRYLLRIETSSPKLFAELHPAHQRFDTRLACLRDLRAVGFQVGTGVMIGLPGQSIEDLADDIAFLREMDVDMIGMGPYLVHHETPMARHRDEMESRHNDVYQLALNMIAVVRLVLRDVNIASTTALQAMNDVGREDGLEFGANIIMPQLTPLRFKKEYLLYDGKPCIDEDAEKCRGCLELRIHSIGREIARDEWGDSRHVRMPTPRQSPRVVGPASPVFRELP